MLTILLLAIIVGAAFVIESALGFGATMVTVAFSALLLPIDQVLPAFVPINIFLSGYIAVRYRADISWRLLLRRVLPFMGAGLPVGFYLYGSDHDRELMLGLAVFVVVVSTIELIGMVRKRDGEPRPLPMVAQVIILLAGGVIYGAYTAGGPMAIYVAGRELPGKAEFRATLCTLWLVLNVALVIGYALAGDLTRDSAALGAWLVAPLIIGTLLGDWLQTRINARLFRLLVFLLLLAAGFILFGKNL